MLGFGGAGGIINMSYQLNETIHNTQWVTGHFHLIFGGAIVIMYFMIAYDLWPQLTRCAPLPQGLVKAQLWLWFVGMLVLSMPWHLVGLLGMPRRMAYYDYSNPALQPQAWTVTASTIGGLAARDLGDPVRVRARPRAPSRADAARRSPSAATAHAGERTPAAAEQLRAVGGDDDRRSRS